ncbi:MAG: hypothetical protein HWD82_00110 [Flavobacteriaceae bacterium]|nr:hypothetical protein [Flavobacteriaceae bacterium]
MRNLKSIIAIVALSLATTFSTSASDDDSKKVTKKLRSEISSILGKSVSLDLKENSVAEITFMVNKDNEIVIVSVDTKESEFQSIVKSKLNYKKLDVKGVKKGEIYLVPVKLKAS